MGRPAHVSGLGLENTKIEIDHGSVKIDAYQNTTVPGVYAIGDVTKNMQLTPVAIRAGRILV